jgi:hypothetical protein
MIGNNEILNELRELNRKIYVPVGPVELLGGLIGLGLLIVLLALFPLSLGIFIPLSLIGFLCQRIFISLSSIRRVLKAAFSAMAINAALLGVFLHYGWITWLDIQHLYTPSAIQYIGDYKGSMATGLLMVSILLWSGVLILGLCHQVISNFYSKSEDSLGHGLLNVFCLISGGKPKPFLTTLQNLGLFAVAFHAMKNNDLSFSEIAITVLAVSMLPFWCVKFYYNGKQVR